MLAVAPVPAEDAAAVRAVDHEEPLVLVADELLHAEAAPTVPTGDHVPGRAQSAFSSWSTPEPAPPRRGVPLSVGIRYGFSPCRG